MVAFVSSLLVLLAGVGLILVVAKRRPVDRPLTWGEAFIAGTFVFFLLFWAYGVVPHQWLTWADNELNWRADSFFLETYPIKVTKAAVRDVVAVGIYGAFLGGQIALWSIWQNRGKAKPAPVEPSAYGRPLVRPPAEGA